MKTAKKSSKKDGMQTLQMAFNDSDASITTSGFLTGKVGHKITLEIITTNVADDTEVYSFFDETNLLYEIKLVYTGASKSQLISAERIA